MPSWGMDSVPRWPFRLLYSFFILMEDGHKVDHRSLPLNEESPSTFMPKGFLWKKVGETGFEPATSWSQTKRSSQAELHPAIDVLPILGQNGNLDLEGI